jgi:chaperonin GroES
MTMLYPTQDKVLIKPAPREKKTASGLHIPDTVREGASLRGVVNTVGPGRYIADKFVEPLVKSGDTVIYRQVDVLAEIEFDDESFVVIKERDLLGVVVE